MTQESRPKAILVGDAPGFLLPYAAADLGHDHKLWQKHGIRFSPETDRLLGEEDCIVATIHEQLTVLVEARDLCRTCKVAIQQICGLLQDLIEGAASAETLEDLRQASEDLRDNGDCATALRAAALVLASLQFFLDEFLLHAVNRHCPAKACPRLIPAPCQSACPTGIDIPGYLALVAQGRYEEALQLIREDNPFPWVCGLICPHPCEKTCMRAQLDQPVNIRYPKAFVAHWAAGHTRYPTSVPAPPNGKKVAIVGSGPAGLSAAHYLALKGYRVTIFEALPIAGGLLMTGIPEYRLPRDVVRREIEAIQSMGVEIRTNTTVGRDVDLDRLREQGFQAFFLAIGTHRAFQLDIEGERDFPQVLDALAFLRRVNLGDRTKPADTVVVVGGGNSAMDAARTCLRIGCREVHVAYRRTRHEMPANPSEVMEAEEEGVQFHFLTIPVRVVGDEGRVCALECLRAELGEPDSGGRRRPIPVEGSLFRIHTGAIIPAIGQQPDFAPFSGHPPVAISSRNLILTQVPHTFTGVSDIFAGGDAVLGPATVVQAVAAGKQAALDIDSYLCGNGGRKSIFVPSKRPRLPFVPMTAAEKIGTGRVPVPLLAAEVRKRSFDAVELPYEESEARREAARCLRCDVCIRCGACERVCGEEVKVGALKFKEVGSKQASSEERILADFEYPGNTCITCGACTLVCPTGAMELVETGDSREIRLCGTILNQLATIRCHICGAPFVPQRYLEYVTSRSDMVMGKRVLRKLCPQCARAQRARYFAVFPPPRP